MLGKSLISFFACDLPIHKIWKLLKFLRTKFLKGLTKVSFGFGILNACNRNWYKVCGYMTFYLHKNSVFLAGCHCDSRCFTMWFIFIGQCTRMREPLYSHEVVCSFLTVYLKAKVFIQAFCWRINSVSS